MRLVLDTNIIVSGLIWGGIPRQLLELGRDNQAMLFTSSPFVISQSQAVEKALIQPHTHRNRPEALRR